MPKVKQTIGQQLQDERLLKDEIELRSVGAWHDVKGDPKNSHYFMMKNESSYTAISLCFQIVSTLENLRTPIAGKRCLVCNMYAQSREEVKRSQLARISELSEQTQTQTQNEPE